MARIILEDMKLNKNRRQNTSQPKEEMKFFDKLKIKEKPLQEEKAEEKIVRNEKIDNSLFLNKKRIERTPQIRMKPRIIHKSVLLFFICSLLLGGVYWGGNLFQKADINITPKHQIITYKNKPFIASKSSGASGIDFEIMIMSDKKTKDIVLTEPKDVSIKAKGSITLYNEFGTTSQKLLAGTFVADNTGKTYKIDTTITIPGYKTINKKIVPGSAVVNVTAFLPGSSYNGSPENFYISSFKGTTKYTKIYGKLNSPLTGGATGLVYTLTDSDKINVDKIAQTGIKNDLITQVKTLVPPGYILYSNATAFSYKINDNVLSEDPKAGIEIEGTLAVVLLKEKSVVDNILKVSLPEIKGDELREIKINNLDKLVFNFNTENQLITKDLQSIDFSFSGEVEAIWNPDADALKTKLLGIKKDNVLPIFRQDPGIASAIVKIFPPWQKSIPINQNKINIIIN